MQISPGQNQATPIEAASNAAAQVKNERASSQLSAATAEKAAVTEAAPVAAPLQRETDVTYRQDSNGRVYYSVSDAKSGEEILEVPPKALRDVSQGIEEYLKEVQSKAASHVKIKA